MPFRKAHPEDEALALLALGSLPAAEAEAVERHLASCARCRRLFAARRGDLAALAESVEPVAPPPSARGELLARLAGLPAGGEPAAPAAPTSAPVVARRRRGARLVLPLAASFLLGALAGAFVVRQSVVDDVRELAATADALAAERAAAVRERRRLAGELAAARAALALTPAPEAVPLAGLAAAPQARGRVFVDRSRGRALFVAQGLPELPAGRTYQLWRIVDGRPLSAGLLAAGEGTVIVERVDATAGEVWAVTVEPAGGVDSPSGAMVLSS